MALLLVAAFSILIVSSADAQRRKKERERERPAPVTPADKRDSLVNAPGTPFHGKSYWQALGQCGGIYFRLNTLYSEAAIRTKVVKPDPPASARFSKQADEASKTATAYFVGAERFLVADRAMAKNEAIMTYDARASEAGDHLKTIDAALQAAKPCPALYQTCRASFPKACTEPLAAAARVPLLPVLSSISIR